MRRLFQRQNILRYEGFKTVYNLTGGKDHYQEIVKQGKRDDQELK